MKIMYRRFHYKASVDCFLLSFPESLATCQSRSWARFLRVKEIRFSDNSWGTGS
jgi:hypothetical protein